VRWRAIGALLVCAVHCGPLQADLPLSVDDLFTAHHRYRVETGLEYSNREFSEPAAGYAQGTDVLVGSVGLRYGLTVRTELFARVYGYYSQTRIQDGRGLQVESSADWNRVVAGANIQFSADNKSPALLGFAAFDLVENPADPALALRYASSASMGFTTYRSIDPLLLSAVVRYDYRAGYRQQGLRVQPGHGLVISPQTAFAINHLVTLTGGLEWEWRQGVQVQDRQLTLDRTRTSILLGLGYNWSEDITVSFNGEFAVTDSGGASLSVNLVHSFDDRRGLRRKLESSP
jgi:hypothetical protein